MQWSCCYRGRAAHRDTHAGFCGDVSTPAVRHRPMRIAACAAFRVSSHPHHCGSGGGERRRLREMQYCGVCDARHRRRPPISVARIWRRHGHSPGSLELHCGRVSELIACRIACIWPCGALRVLCRRQAEPHRSLLVLLQSESLAKCADAIADRLLQVVTVRQCFRGWPRRVA